MFTVTVWVPPAVTVMPDALPWQVPPPVVLALREIESPVAAGMPPSWNSMDWLLFTATVPGLGAPGSVIAVPELLRRSYVTLEMTAPPGSVSANPRVPVPLPGSPVIVDVAPCPSPPPFSEGDEEHARGIAPAATATAPPRTTASFQLRRAIILADIRAPPGRATHGGRVVTLPSGPAVGATGRPARERTGTRENTGKSGPRRPKLVPHPPKFERANPEIVPWAGDQAARRRGVLRDSSHESESLVSPGPRRPISVVGIPEVEWPPRKGLERPEPAA